MEFFVPTVDGEGRMEPEEAEVAWQACRKGAEGEMGQEAKARRVYRLQYRHNGKSMSAIVGEREQHDERELVMAIIAFPHLYKICTTIRGYLKVGDTPMVGLHDAGLAEDFEVHSP